MASTPHNESLDAVWHSISADSASLFNLAASSSHSRIVISSTKTDSRPTLTISVSCAFPSPLNITSDFLSLGLRSEVAQGLSSNYLSAVQKVRDAYEEQYNRTNETCAQLAEVASDMLLPGLLTRLRDSFVSRYMNLQREWAREALLVAQQTLAARNLRTVWSLTVENSFAEFSTSYQRTPVSSTRKDLERSSRPSWRLSSDAPSSPHVAGTNTALVFEAQPEEYEPAPSMISATENLAVLPAHRFVEFRSQSPRSAANEDDCLDVLHSMSLNTPTTTERTPQLTISSSPFDAASSHSTVSLFTRSKTPLRSKVAVSSVQTPLSPPPTPPATATVTKGRHRKLAGLPKRSIKEATSPLSASTPTPPISSSDFQFKPSEPEFSSSTLRPKSMFAADDAYSSSSVFSPLTPRAPAPSSFLSLAHAKDETPTTMASSSSASSPTPDMPAVSPPSTAHPLFGRHTMAPLPSTHTYERSEASVSQDWSSRPSLAPSPVLHISSRVSIASDESESESSSTVFDHLSTPSSSQSSAFSSPLSPVSSHSLPTLPSTPTPPSKGRRRKMAPLPSRHVSKEPTFSSFSDTSSRESSVEPTFSPWSRESSLAPSLSDVSELSSPEPDTLLTPPSSPRGTSLSFSPVVFSPESRVSEPLLFAFARSHSEHDRNDRFRYGSPPPTSKPLQKQRLDLGYPSIDQTLQGNSASFSFSFGQSP